MKSFLGILLLALLAGCGAQLTALDKRYNPYDDTAVTLVFKNEQSNTLRLYVLGSMKGREHKNNSFGTVPYLKVYASSYEGARMSRRDPPPVLLELVKTSKQSPMNLQIELADQRFKGTVSQQSEWDSVMVISGTQYEDIEMVANKNIQPKTSITPYAKYIYWSRKKGLVAIDMSNNTRYSLTGTEAPVKVKGKQEKEF